MKVFVFMSLLFSTALNAEELFVEGYKIDGKFIKNPFAEYMTESELKTSNRNRLRHFVEIGCNPSLHSIDDDPAQKEKLEKACNKIEELNKSKANFNEKVSVFLDYNCDYMIPNMKQFQSAEAEVQKKMLTACKVGPVPVETNYAIEKSLGENLDVGEDFQYGDAFRIYDDEGKLPDWKVIKEKGGARIIRDN